jgi:small subunit ribosomal protein S21
MGYTLALGTFRKNEDQCDDMRAHERMLSGMIKVKARGNESIEQMLRRFKKMCEKEGLTKEIKRTSYYEKPSERRRRRVRKSIKRYERTFPL